MAYPDGRDGAGRRRDALLCLIYFAGEDNYHYQLAPSETYKPLAEFFKLSEYERTRPISSSDNRVYWENLIQNSRQQLISYGYLDGSRREVWKLTYEGVNRAKKIAHSYDELRQYQGLNLKPDRRVGPTAFVPTASKIENVHTGNNLAILQKDDVNESSTEELVESDIFVLETPQAKDFNEPAEPNRVLYQNYRILRDTKLARQIKSLHQFKCQICGDTIELSNGTKYAEAHHLKPLGSPHNGPDTAENIICVCPNHHVYLDYGAIRLEKDKLIIHLQHSIGNEYIDYYNKVIFEKSAEVL